MKALEVLLKVALRRETVEIDKGSTVTLRALTFGENMRVTKTSRSDKIGPEGEVISEIDGALIMEETLLLALLDDDGGQMLKDDDGGREVIQNLPCTLAVKLMQACAVLNGTASVEEEAGNSEAPPSGSSLTGSRGSSENSSGKLRRRRSRKS